MTRCRANFIFISCPGLLGLAATLVTINFQTLKAALANPVESLKRMRICEFPRMKEETGVIRNKGEGILSFDLLNYVILSKILITRFDSDVSF